MNKDMLQDVAVVVIDVQNDYCAREGKIATQRNARLTQIQDMVPTLNFFLDSIRERTVPLFFVRMDKSKERAAKNLGVKLDSVTFPFSEELCVPGTFGFEYYNIEPQEGDFQFVKNTYDAFSNKDLPSTLQKMGIKTVIITGVYSTICIDASVKGAFSRGFNVVICKDLIADQDGKENDIATCLQQWSDLYGYVVSSELVLTIVDEAATNYINQQLLTKEDT